MKNLKSEYSVEYKVTQKERKKGMKTWFDNFYWLKVMPVVIVSVLGVLIPLILVFKTEFPDKIAIIMIVAFAIVGVVAVKLIEPSETEQEWHITNETPDKEKMILDLTDEAIIIRPDTGKKLEEAIENNAEMNVYYFKDNNVKAIERKKFFALGTKKTQLIETIPKDELEEYANIQIRELLLKEFSPKRFIDKKSK